MANLQAYQAKLLEVAQANMQFAFELFQRLATVRSPFVLGALFAEFTGRRVLMTAKHSKELAALWRIDPLQKQELNCSMTASASFLRLQPDLGALSLHALAITLEAGGLPATNSN